MNYLESEQINEEGDGDGESQVTGGEHTEEDDDDGESQVTGEEHTEEGSASEYRWVQIKID